jgi:adenylyltransferase/sulfurtransferase
MATDVYAPPVTLSNEEILRYSRHLIMPEVAMEGQLRLKQASVLLVGAGGLGSPLGLYLAAAGIGRIGLVDYDVVDYTNLQRQSSRHQGRGPKKLDSTQAHEDRPHPGGRHDRVTGECLDIIANRHRHRRPDNFPTVAWWTAPAYRKPITGRSWFRGQVTVSPAMAGVYRYPSGATPGLVPVAPVASWASSGTIGWFRPPDRQTDHRQGVGGSADALRCTTMR